MGLLDLLFGKKKPEIKNIPGIKRVILEKVKLDAETAKEAEQRFISFDIETTGLNFATDEIVELGAVIYENGEPAYNTSTLINICRPMPAAATKVNHITTDMLSSAPMPFEVYPKFKQFLGDALEGKTIMCAHNADFDFGFLKAAFESLGYGGKIRYIDTLGTARGLYKSDSYKQSAVAEHFSIESAGESHRAVNDAYVCGQILLSLISLQKDIEAKEKKRKAEQAEAARLSDEELELCAAVQKMITDAGLDTSVLRFKRTTQYIGAYIIGDFLKIKSSKKGKYAVIPAGEGSKVSHPVEACTATEGGTDYIRMYFDSPLDLYECRDGIVSEYRCALKQLDELKGSPYFNKDYITEVQADMTALSSQEVEKIMDAVAGKDYGNASRGVQVKEKITRDQVTVTRVPDRCAVSKISKERKPTVSLYDLVTQGEFQRKKGNIEKALELYDQAREAGYFDPWLYECYAVLYRMAKDYENEILILEEFFARGGADGSLEAQLSRAIESLYKVQQAEREKEAKIAEKAEKAARREAEKEALKAEREAHKDDPKGGRPVFQLDDDGNVIAEYLSVTAASDTVGVSTKCIRDAIAGKQKHAGGYCWKYKE